MENALQQSDSHNFVTLKDGTPDDIRQALIQLGAPADIVAKSISFLVKLPGKVVSKIEGGFQIGNSFLPETPNKINQEVHSVQNRFAGILAANN